jgi:hypothetical protein
LPEIISGSAVTATAAAVTAITAVTAVWTGFPGRAEVAEFGRQFGIEGVSKTDDFDLTGIIAARAIGTGTVLTGTIITGTIITATIVT